MIQITVKYSYIDEDGCLVHIAALVPEELMNTVTNILFLKPAYLESVGLKSSQVKSWQVEVED